MHGVVSSHPLVLSFSDLSVWCYPCEAYIDNKVRVFLHYLMPVTYKLYTSMQFIYASYICGYVFVLDQYLSLIMRKGRLTQRLMLIHFVLKAETSTYR